MQRSKSHHWVPQFYLKRWTNEFGRLVSFSRETDRHLIRTPVPKYVACEDLLYTVFLSNGNHIYGEDSIFKRVDQDGAVALEAAVGDNWKNLSNDLAEKLYRFIYLLAVRHPTVRDNFLKTESEIFDHIKSDLEALGQGAYASKFFEDLPKTFTTQRDRATLLMMSLAAFDRFTHKALFYDRPRVFLDTWHRATLLTSDHPFVSAPSIGVEDAMHWFPLAPYRGILWSKDKEKLDFIRKLGFKRAVSYANLLTVLFAQKYLYSNSERDQAIILEHLGGAYRYTKERFSETLMEVFRGKLTVGAIDET